MDDDTASKPVLKLPRLALIAVALVSAVRVFVAFHVPLTEDESYYWTWSRHLALGYVDHPPMVAWLIALTAPLGQNPGFIRLPFIACEAFAALALGRTALLCGGDGRAAGAATVAFLAIPQVRLMIGEALPDGPYLLCWALALYFTAHMAQAPAAEGERRADLHTAIGLGIALGGAILSRFFGWALVFGIVAFALAPKRRGLWRNGLGTALVIAIALYSPFVAWNATHHWVNFTFTVRDRQAFAPFSLTHLSVLSSARFLVYAIIIWIVGIAVAIRPKYALLAWTALPFPTLLGILSLAQTIESYWLLGPFTSLCAGIGLAYGRASLRTRRVLGALTIPAIYTMFSALFLTLPEASVAALLQATHGGLRGISSTVFTYRPFAREVEALIASRRAVALTDQFEIASQLSYYGLAPLIIGPSPQVRQWLQWNDADYVPERALLITVRPLDREADLSLRVEGAYASVRTGPVLRFRYAGIDAASFFTTWCESPRPTAARLLFDRWSSLPQKPAGFKKTRYRRSQSNPSPESWKGRPRLI